MLLRVNMILQALDVLTTFVGLKLFEAKEINPYALQLFDMIGLYSALIVKLLITFMVFMLARKVMNRATYLCFMSIIAVLMSFVVINNLAVIVC